MANRKLIVEITGDTRGLERALGRAGRQTDTMGKRLGGLGKTAAIAAGGAGIGALTLALTRGFDELKESQRVTAQTNAVLKSTGGVANVTAKHVDDLATKIMRYSGIDDEAVKSTENLLLGMTNIRNEVGKGNDIFDRATKVITDFSVRTGKSASTGVAVFGKALNDLAEGKIPKTLRGIGAIPKALQKQMDAMVKAGDVVGAQGLLLDNLEKRYGGAAKAAGDTLPGQINKLQESFNNLAAQGLQVAFDKFEELKPSIDTIIGAINDLSVVLKPMSKLIFDMLVTPMKVVADLLRGDFSQAWKDIKKPIIDARDILVGLWSLIKAPFNEMIDGITGGLTRAANWVDTKAGEIAGFITGIPSRVGDFSKALVARLADVLENNVVSKYLESVPGKFADFFKDLPSAIGKAALSGIKGGMTYVGQMIDKLFGKLSGWVKGILGIASPSKEFVEIGHFIIQGLVKGLEEGGFKVKDAIMELVKKYVLETGWDAFKGFTSEMWDELSNIAGDVGSFFSDLFGGAAGGVANGYAVLPELPATDHPTLGLDGYPAADIMLPAGTVVGAPSRGTITGMSGRPFSEGWSDGPGTAIGLSLYMAGRVADYFLTHFDRLFAGTGATIARGTPIGTVGPMDAYGVKSHIHEGVHRFAMGGIVTRPMVGMVGEAGPEAIIPLGKFRGLGGPSVIQVVLDGRVLAEAVRRENGRYASNNARFA